MGVAFGRSPWPGVQATRNNRGHSRRRGAINCRNSAVLPARLPPLHPASWAPTQAMPNFAVSRLAAKQACGPSGRPTIRTGHPYKRCPTSSLAGRHPGTRPVLPIFALPGWAGLGWAGLGGSRGWAPCSQLHPPGRAQILPKFAASGLAGLAGLGWPCGLGLLTAESGSGADQLEIRATNAGLAAAGVQPIARLASGFSLRP